MGASAESEARASPGQEPGRILPVVRGGLGILLVLAIANGLFLYLVPSRAEPDYAWAIAPPINAAFIGAGYLAGAVTAGLGLFVARYWRSIRPLVPGFWALGALLLAATLIGSEKFRWDYVPTWVWTAVYAVLPPVAAYLWLLQERAPGDNPPRDPSLGPWSVSWVLGIALIAVGAALFVAPDSLLDEWPWPITPLLARVFAGWYVLVGLALAYSAASVARAHEVPITYATVGSWSLLVLVLPALYSEDVDTGAGAFWPWLVLHLVVLAACAWALIQSVRLMRAGRQHL